MIKYPRYIFRSELALQLIRDYVPKDSKFLEIGCADGELSAKIAEIGLTGDAFDLSDEAIKKAKVLIKKEGLDQKVNVFEADLLTYKTPTPYDLVIMLEVLEHIRDDKGALLKIGSLLRGGGFLLVSVPAKMRLWGANDILAGHFRRYEKEELRNLINQMGFDVVKLYSYGFPFLNIVKLPRDFIANRRLKEVETKSVLARSKRSGMNPIRVPLLEGIPIFNRWTLLPFIKLSNLFNNYDLAVGYLCLARKRR